MQVAFAHSCPGPDDPAGDRHAEAGQNVDDLAADSCSNFLRWQGLSAGAPLCRHPVPSHDDLARGVAAVVDRLLPAALLETSSSQPGWNSCPEVAGQEYAVSPMPRLPLFVHRPNSSTTRSSTRVRPSRTSPADGRSSRATFPRRARSDRTRTSAMAASRSRRHSDSCTACASLSASACADRVATNSASPAETPGTPSPGGVDATSWFVVCARLCMGAAAATVNAMAPADKAT